MDTQYPVGLSIREELDHTLSVEVGLRSRVGGEGERSGFVLDIGRLKLLLVLADPGNFGVGVHNGGNGTVVDVAVTLGEELDGGNTLLLGLVGEHRSESDVSNGSNVWDLGAELLVDDQAATLIGLETNVIQAKSGGVRSASNGDKDNISIKGLLLATLRSLNVDTNA